MRKARTGAAVRRAVAGGPAEEQPRSGGSYLRDPVTGRLSRRETVQAAGSVPGTTGRVVDPAEPGAAGADSNPGTAAEGAAPAGTDQEV